jgi:UDP-N-acetylglucosamine 2-epimerase (non-hydrolysing)/GDP/UDP-N,N'-diacetylbacillosamine 2-epimerase (hydrolysing)
VITLPRRKTSRARRVCFVTGTRAEFGLMRTVLDAIDANPALTLQLIVTGMHLDRRHGRTVDQIKADGWLAREHAMVPWRGGDGSASATAAAMGRATADIASAISNLKSQIVLVAGDRVEAFAAAAAGHVAGCVVAHVHGGDRALGQVDDSLRHAITKLSHIHFPATAASAQRIERLGEDRWRIHRAGSPGVDGIVKAAQAGFGDNPTTPIRSREKNPGHREYGPNPAWSGGFALLVLHPSGADVWQELARAHITLKAIRRSGIPHTLIVYPNNDPGSAGIIRCWETEIDPTRETVMRNVPRATFLGLMRDAAVLVGNSSSGIIEAASFGTPVVDIGPRQLGRERGSNVVNVPFIAARIEREVRRIWNGGRPVRFEGRNIYGGNGAGRRIAAVLARTPLDDRLRRKLIAY